MKTSDFGAKTFDFKDFFTFEMANNHQGSVSHGKKIIKEVASVAKEFGVRGAVKLQLRELDTFIHPDYKKRDDLKHIPRFLSTRLSKGDFKELVDATVASGLHTMATPFDEPSVDILEELGVEIIKVASASALDFPLLQKISEKEKPVIVSVGGLTIADIDKVVSFLEHRGVYFALMHCVAIYPTPSEKMFLRQIEIMKNRYPHLTVGFSTHEPPSNTSIIGLAYAKGARIFEKHVGVPAEGIKLNSYSASPEELRLWIMAFIEARNACGDCEAKERPIDEAEARDLQSLKRCVYAKNDIRVGQKIARDEVFFAMPMLSSVHLESGQFKEGLVADRDYKSGEALSIAILPKNFDKKAVIYGAVRQAKGMLNEAKIPLSHDFTVEISHHYGLENFEHVGCIIIDCINREYAKKLIVQFANQFHPTHYHKIKDESFHVLWGAMEIEVEGRKKALYPGDTLWVPRGVWHSFKTDTGVIFEEISTTSMEANGDSFYIDKKIAKMTRDSRKTRLLNWGRHQFDN
ncbi:MAG: N-acetylneuraminate synthase family protein [bacterium]|nr:N-acetylneuraminate synthase family protein [bacterium]